MRLDRGVGRAAALLVLALLSICEVVQAKPQRDGFYYGMPQAEAERLLESTADYELAYRVDTASTADIFCRYQRRTLYLGHFLHGECVSVEKRALVTREDMERMFAAYNSALGTPGKGSDSRDGALHFARWSWKDRVLELNATARGDGGFLLEHREFSPDGMREAILTQQRELRDAPPLLDPLTGKPLAPSSDPAQQAALANAASPGEIAWEEAVPPSGEGQPADAVSATEAAEPKPASKSRETPRITGKNDWD